MTRARLLRNVWVVIAIYLVAIAAGVLLRAIDRSGENVHYATYQDLLPLIIALPAAYLGYCFQQRLSFLQYLRSSWKDIVEAVNGAIAYAEREHPTEEEQREVLVSLYVAIDVLRGLYRNVGETPQQQGDFSWEPIRTIMEQIRALRPGSLTECEAQRRRALSKAMRDRQWKPVRKAFLAEFDRPTPTKAVTAYLRLTTTAAADPRPTPEGATG